MRAALKKLYAVIVLNKIFELGLASELELYDEITCNEETATGGNSFFERSYFGTRILILAVRFGDEILIAGNTILNLSAARAEIFVAYADYDKKMLNENIEALKILGVDSKKIIYMNRDRLSKELKRLILKLRANVIFCVDYDSDLKYQDFSALFDKVLGEILNEHSNYRPEIYKRFACATALNCPADFYAPNLLPVEKPKYGVTNRYDFDLIGRVNYIWNNRVRFPVPEHCRKPLLKDNPLAEAIFAYKKNHWSVLRILNSDEVFFERRTDNQAYCAKVSNVKVCDFKMVRDDVCADKQITFEWTEAVQVRRIVIYGNLFDEESAQIKIRLALENDINKEKIIEAELPKFGRPLILDVGKIFVLRAEIEAIKCGEDFGIAEVEFFAQIEPIRKISPFIKMTIGDNFFYRYDIPCEVEKISLGLYRFHVDEPIKITAMGDDENILTETIQGDEELILNLGAANEIILTAEVISNPSIYDKATIRRVGDLAQIQLKIWQWLDKMRIHKIRNI